MKHRNGAEQTSKKPRKGLRKATAAATLVSLLTSGTALGLATYAKNRAEAAAAASASANKGGDGDIEKIPADATPAREYDERAAAVVANVLSDAMNPAEPGAQKGGDGNPEFDVMDGYLEAIDEDTGENIRVVDPIVPLTQKPLGELATSWIVVQGYDKKGQLMFKPLDLSEYEWVTFHPVDPADPYMSTHGAFVPAKGKPGQEQMQMIECGPNGEEIPNADIPGQVMSTFVPQDPAIPRKGGI